MPNYNSISFKMILGFFIIIFIVGFNALYISFELRGIAQETKLLNQGYFPYLKYLSKIDTNLDNDKQIIQRFITEKEYKSSYAKIIKARYKAHPVNKIFKQTVDHIDKVRPLFNFKNGKRFLSFSNEEIIILSNYYSDFMESCVGLIDDDRMLNKCKTNSNKLSSRINYLLKRIENNLLTLSTKIETRENNTSVYQIIFTSISIFLTIIIAIISLFSLYPIKKLIQATSIIKDGDYSHHVEFNSKNELGILADSFNEMVDTLKEKELHIEKQNQTFKENHKKEIERKRLAAVGKLSSLIAHEIRNPLNSITLNTDIIEDEMYSENFSPQEIKPLFDSIKKEIARLVEITEGYLQLTKKPKFNKKIVDITALIYETIKFIEPEFNQKKIESEVILDKNRQVFIEIDENKIKQALINIIKNAMEAIDSDGKITIKLVEKDDSVVINITDNGIGISEKDIGDIFELFLTTKKYGTGLGLFSVKETIEEHGGKIVCNSTFGKGTTFSIYLPLNENLNRTF